MRLLCKLSFFLCLATLSVANALEGSDYKNIATIQSSSSEFEVNLSDNASDATALPKGMVISKTADDGQLSSPTKAGDIITYQFEIDNIGLVPLTSPTITDPLLGSNPISYLSGDTDNDGSIGADETWLYQATYSITQNDLDSNGGGDGDIDNEVTIATTELSAMQATAVVSIEQSPSLSVEKSVDLTEINAPQTLTYTIVLANDGNVSLSGINLVDLLSQGSSTSTLALEDVPSELSVDSTAVLTANYFVDQAQIDNGADIINAITAASVEAATETDSVSTTIQVTPILTVAKTASLTTYAFIGQTIEYQYIVTNSGNVTVRDVALTDDKLGGISGCSSDTLAPKESVTCTASHSVTQQDISNGALTNLAAPSGTVISGALLNITDSVTVNYLAHVIDAVDNSYTGINGADGATTASILDNDQLNGSALNTASVTLTVIDNNNTDGVSIGDDGKVTVDSGTTAGEYALQYQICEVLNPTNCDTATVTVTVEAADIDAVDNSYTGINGVDGATTASILDNDTLNGSALNTASITLTVIDNDSADGVSIGDDGKVTVDSGTAAGEYALQYQICEVLNPTNCDTATVTVTVETADIDAVDNSYTGINGADGATTASILDSDQLNGSALNTASVTLTVIDNNNTDGVSIGDDGKVTVDSGTAAGEYALQYQICEVLNPTNCDTATVTVTVEAADIDAVDNSYTGINGADGATTASILDNDTLNGSALNTASITLTVIDNDSTDGVSIGTDGKVTVDSGTAAGEYTLQYQICEVLNPTNCDTATVTVTVEAADIDAVDNSYTGINGADGATTASILDNDTLNGSALNTASITLTVIDNDSADGVSIGDDGKVTVDSGTAAGEYALQYQICEALNPTNCDTATVTVTVEAADIDAIDNSYTGINGADGATTASILDNDQLNDRALNTASITLTVIDNDSADGVSIGDDGKVTVDSGTAAGEYALQYQICEVLNPTNCDTATVTVTVEAADIDAVDNSYTGLNGADGATTASILDNDTLNGSALNTASVTLTVIDNNTTDGVSIGDDGKVTIDSGTAAGEYALQYQICEVLNPTNCDTATVTVIVEAADIDAVDNSYTGINGADGATTASILDNDTLNGSALNTASVTLTVIDNDSTDGVSIGDDGKVTVDSGTAAGEYALQYQICEVLNPTNCDTATVTVTVEAADIDAVDNSYTGINGANGATTASILDNDRLNGSALNTASITLTVIDNNTTDGVSIGTDGKVTVDSGTAAGEYALQYQICEVLNPTNCDTATVTVTVEAADIDAVDNSYTGINGADGATTASILDNDTLNGSALNTASVTLTVIDNTTTDGVSIGDDGKVTVDSGTAAGEYALQYQICEVLNPTNCDTATVTVTVEAADIDAVDNSYTGINGADGATTASILDNDQLNGSALNTASITLTVIDNDSTDGVSIGDDGKVTVDSGTTAGEYALQYQICEVLNPTNCDTATVTVTVEAADIDAIDNTFSGINGADGATTASILDNDTLNGSTLNTASATLTVIDNDSTDGVSIGDDGNVTVDSGTASGEYALQYQICEVLNPTNCDTATVTVTVEAADIDAVDNSYTGINGADGATTTSVLDNDTLNGSALNTASVTLTVIDNDSADGVSIGDDGKVTVDSGTAAGEYALQYQICEVLNPTNCDTATVTVTVEAADIDAIDNSYTGINGADGATTTSVLDNDTLNGSALNTASVTLTVIDNDSADGVSIGDDGKVTVDSGTAAGEYALQYQICEVLNPTNCDTATVTVTVEAADIDAIDNSYTGINGADGATTASILDNDTLNGSALNTASVTLTVIDNDSTDGVSIGDDGKVTVDSGTAAGEYALQYQICEVLNPTNCDTATVTVTVEAADIDAVDNSYTGINSADGATTASILDNDTLNGSALNTASVTLTVIDNDSADGVSIGDDGKVTVDSGTAAGEYTLQYQICEVLNPTNCDTATVTVTVEAADIDAIDNTFSGINGADGATTASILDNDTLNGSALNTASVTLTVIDNDSTDGVSIGTDGKVTVDSGTAAGEYTLQYQICEVLNLTNCDTATVTVTVEKADIDAVDNSYTGINGVDGATTVSILDNDQLNGSALNTASVTLTVIDNDSADGVSIGDDGKVTVDSGTAAGEYALQYQICEVLNPTNCDTATVTVTVEAADIDAVDNSYTGINGADGATTASILDNDTLNGSALNTASVTLTVIDNDSADGVSIGDDGKVTVDSGTAAGEYALQYQICEVLNSTNCDTATVTVTVETADIDAVDNSYTGINGADGATTPSILDNDTLNGSALNTASVTLRVIDNDSADGVSIGDDGKVTVDSGTAAGEYALQYQICEVLNPTNCDTATVTVIVEVADIDAVDNSYTGINGADGAITASILDNDQLNGSVLNTASITLTVIDNDSADGVSIGDDGKVTVDSGTAAGEYALQYQICEVLNPTNCDTATVTVTVEAADIDAIDNTFSGINGADGATTASILDNDTLNGSTLNTASVTLTVIDNDSADGVSIGDDGKVTVDSGTAAGEYALQYQICEVLNPTNCDTATVTVTVEAADIDAVDNSYTGINSADGATTASILDNDTLNGSALNTASVTLTVIDNDSADGVSIGDDGKVTVDSGTAAGEYTLQYQICEVLNPTNCDTATVTVTVEAADIDAVDNSYTGINGADGATTASILDNDTLNGSALNTASITLTVIDNDSADGVSIGTDGKVTVGSGTAAGEYTLQYQICEVLNPTNCDTATVTVTVETADIDAVDNSYTGINGVDGATTVSILDNDQLNGSALNTASVTLTVIDNDSTDGVSIDDDKVTIDSGTAAGEYALQYQICEVLNPTNCDTATVTVTVEAADIDAVDNSYTGINGVDGATTASILDNDQLNGSALNTASVTLTVIDNDSADGVSIGDDGKVTVDSGTAAGEYALQYQICEVLNPTNCDTATVTVTVEAADIDAVDNSYTGINGADGATTASILDNDTLNGSALNTVSVTLTVINNDSTDGVSIGTDGKVTVDSGTAAGEYALQYQICEVLNPTNCDTATVTVTVEAADIDAVDNSYTGINGADGATTASILDNDTLNGSALNTASITLTVIDNNTTDGVSIGDDGKVTVDSGTAAGEYALQYQICEVLNPTNCDTATVTVTVEAADIDAVDNTFSGINGADGATTASILDNDTLNGSALNTASITLTVIDDNTTDGVSIGTDGKVTVDSGTAAGEYTLQYQICEVLNPTNCDTATVTVTVISPAINAIDDNFTGINGADGTTTDSILINDELNGNTATTSSVSVEILENPLSSNLTVTDNGQVVVASATQAGIYIVIYKICERLNSSNCDTATVTITVIAPVIEAIDDGMQVVAGSTVSSSIFGNDLLNGAAMNQADMFMSEASAVTDSSGNTNSTIVVNDDGSVTASNDAAPGVYQIVYKICEVLNTDNCDTATVTVVISDDNDGIAPTSEELSPNNGDANGDGIKDRVQTLVSSLKDCPPGAQNCDVNDVETDDRYWVSLSVVDSSGNALNDKCTAVQNAYSTNENATGIPGPNDVAGTNQSGNGSWSIGEDTDYIYPLGLIGFSLQCTEPNQTVTGIRSIFYGHQKLLDDGTISSTDDYAIRKFADPTGPVDDNSINDAEFTYMSNLVPVSVSEENSPCECDDNGDGQIDKVLVITYSLSDDEKGDSQKGLFTDGNYRIFDPHGPAIRVAEPILDPLVITKSANKQSANVGDLLVYTIKVSNPNTETVSFNIYDKLPVGLQLLSGDGKIRSQQVEDITLSNEDNITVIRNAGGLFSLDGDQSLSLVYVAQVGPGATTNEVLTNTAYTGTENDNVSSNVAFATVRLDAADPIFDLSTIVGKVFVDANQNGAQDPGEKGIAGARLATVTGDVIVTDRHGRYHIPGLESDVGSNGKNFVIKLDKASLPSCARIISENPRVVRLTSGLMSRFNFGVILDNGAVHKTVEPTEVLETIYFKNGNAEVSVEQISRLKSRLTQYQNDPNIRVRIVGHTDNDRLTSKKLLARYGDNYGLSHSRAQTVGNILKQKLHLDSGSYEFAGYGPDHPIASNSTVAGKAKNRRVEIQLVTLTESASNVQCEDGRDSNNVNIKRQRPADDLTSSNAQAEKTVGFIVKLSDDFFIAGDVAEKNYKQIDKLAKILETKSGIITVVSKDLALAEQRAIRLKGILPASATIQIEHKK